MFPASAGMILIRAERQMDMLRVPRIRGDDPGTEFNFKGLHKCSPHPRG